MIYLYLFGTCFHFIYVFMIIGNILLFVHLKYGKLYTWMILVYMLLSLDLKAKFVIFDSIYHLQAVQQRF